MIDRAYLKSLQSFSTEREYRESPSLNFSTLKEIPNGPFVLVAEKEQLTGPALEVGDYVDKYFTDRDRLDELYDVSKPKIVLTESIEALFQAFVEEQNFTPSINECVSKCREMGIYASMVDDEKVKARIPDSIFEKLVMERESTGKIVMTQDQYSQAMFAIANIKNNPSAMELITEGDDEIIITQFKWEFKLPLPETDRFLVCKVMYDFLKFNLKQKRISSIEMKTGARPSHGFAEQIVEYRLDIQSILYYIGMMALRKKYFPEWEKCKPEDYTFLYSPKKEGRQSIIVSLSEQFIHLNGVRMFYNGNTYEGFWNIIQDVDWYISNQIFDSHRLISESNGILSIDKLFLL